MRPARIEYQANVGHKVVEVGREGVVRAVRIFCRKVRVFVAQAGACSEFAHIKAIVGIEGADVCNVVEFGYVGAITDIIIGGVAAGSERCVLGNTSIVLIGEYMLSLFKPD